MNFVADEESMETYNQTGENHLVLFTNLECPTWTTEDKLIAENVSFYIDGIFVCIIAVIGLLMNSVAIFIMCKEKQGQHIFNRLIRCLFCIHNWVLCTAVQTRLYTVFKIEALGMLFPWFSHPFYHIFLTTSIYMTVVMAVERTLVTNSPAYYYHLAQTSSSKTVNRRLITYIIPIFIFSFVYNIPKFLEFELDDDRVAPTHLLKQSAYRNQYQNWWSLFVLGIIPYVILLYLSLMIYMSLAKQEDATKLVLDTTKGLNLTPNRPYGLDHAPRNGYKGKQRDNELSRLMLGLICSYLIFHLPQLIDNLYTVWIWSIYVKCTESEKIPGMPVWKYHFSIFGYVMVAINSAMNMPLYIILRKSFSNAKMFTKNCRNQAIRKHNRTLSEIKGEPDGSSQPVLIEQRLL